MKAVFFLFLIFATAAISLYSQNCGYYYFQSNKTVTMGVFNKKGSSEGKVVYKIGSVNKSGGATIANINSEVFDKKNKSLGTSSGRMQCKGGMLLIDMSTMMSPQQSSQFKNAEVDGKGFYLEYPNTLKEGQTLKDGSLNLDVKMEGGIAAKIIMDITNRTVVAKESVTTPAGTWDAYKITYSSKTVIDMGFAIPMKIDIIVWYVLNFGVVKSEYKTGKMELLSVE